MPDRIMTAEARITARDATGRVFDQVSHKMRGIERTAKGVNGTMTGAVGRVAGLIGGFVGPAGVVALASRSVQEFATTERRLGRILTTAGAGAQDFRSTLATVQQIALQTGMSTDQVLAGLEAKVAQGSTLQEALAQMPIIVRTAQAAGAETQDIANSIGAIGEQLKVATPQMQTAMDMLVTSGKEGKFELKDMSRYLPQIAAAAAATGESGLEGLNRVAAALQVVRTGTGTSEEAATNLMNVFAKMNSEETIKKFGKFGIDLPKRMAQAKKEGKDALETFVALAKEAVHGDLSKLPQLFTDMQVQGGMRALITGMDELRRQMEVNRNGVGAMARDLTARLRETQTQIDLTREAWTQMVASLGEAAAPQATTLLKNLRDLMGVAKTLADMKNAPDTASPAEVPLFIPAEGAQPLPGVVEAYQQGSKADQAAAQSRRRRTLEDTIISLSKKQQALIDRNRDLGIPESAAGESSYLRQMRAAKHELNQIELDRVGLYRFARPPEGSKGTVPRGGFWLNPEFPGSTSFAPGPRPGIPLPPERPGGRSEGSLRSIEEALSAGKVKAELEGQAQVNIAVSVQASPLLQAMLQQATSASGHIAVNGPGSVGTSSPDAAAPARTGGIGHQ